MHVSLSKEDLQPLVKEIVSELLLAPEGEHLALSPDGRLAYSEPEAATLLGLPAHRLRDARLRGEISARKVGRAYRYARSELIRFIQDFDS